ncbi:PAC2 family protein [Chloroflexota bacterium]
MDRITVLKTPELNNPRLIIAFAGWPDAAEVATRTVDYLVNKMKGIKFAEFDTDEFLDFTKSRPTIVVEDGVLTQINHPYNSFYYCRSDRPEHDLVLLQGTEPHLRWRTFFNTLLGFAKQLGVNQIITLGGLYDNVSHTRPPKVTAIVNTVALKTQLHDLGIETTNYQGPGAIHSVLLSASSKAKLQMISLWGHSPFYLRGGPNAKVCQALVVALNQLLDINLAMNDFEKSARQMDVALDRLMSKNQNLRSHIQRLEQEHDTALISSTPLEGSDKIINDVEEFLRREQQRDKENDSP